MKIVKPCLPTSLSNDQLSALSSITGKPVFAQTLPFLGRTVVFDGKRTCEKLAGDLPSSGFFETALEERCETREVTRFYVGSKYHGPVLSVEVRDDGVEWCNCFAKSAGGWGKNCTSGGSWMGQLRHERFATWQEALKNRYNPAITLGGERGVAQLKFRESAEFMTALEDFLAANA